jgi:3-oxoacyl-[acyl-carrier protein] reductase
MQLLGKVALVTGGGVGIGRAIALKLARRGCHIAVNYCRSKDAAEETAAEIRKLGVNSIAVQANVATDALVRRMVRETVAELGRLDILINNAGVTSVIPHNDLEAVTEEDWDKLLMINLRGPFYTTRAAVKALRASRGVIVNISSAAGVYATGSSIPYCASKAALNNMTVALARALAPEVRVNAVAPGFVDGTRWSKDHPEYQTIKRASTDRSLLKRVCQPDDVATAVVDIASADLLTGQVIVVDGGMGISA